MGNFNKFDRGGRGFGNGHSDRPKQMFPATCSKCGQGCEVPFRPTNDRPVFCSNCFKSQQGGPRPAPKSFGGGIAPANISGASKGQFDALNAKLDKIISLLSSTKATEAPKAKVVKKAKSPAKKAKSKKK